MPCCLGLPAHSVGVTPVTSTAAMAGAEWPREPTWLRHVCLLRCREARTGRPRCCSWRLLPSPTTTPPSSCLLRRMRRSPLTPFAGEPALPPPTRCVAAPPPAGGRRPLPPSAGGPRHAFLPASLPPPTGTPPLGSGLLCRQIRRRRRCRSAWPPGGADRTPAPLGTAGSLHRRRTGQGPCCQDRAGRGRPRLRC